ncbi:ADP-ribosylation factor-like protein 14 [Tritrichomonas foetus]|uniref:ADP-ribosylation factor-like protein 14 n=1 Tax=Tritrichomonas foetus TaxID=1144522 RepID=A0A1J4L1Z5_9EUKA|nr:ADP-ribosylation factor-like protein 14 [Tritrichomonas foetus]|eukprot:OHT17096.1 ADP-ribosylation factor-like protein 14 [Tritrichomonas foetus]
MGCNASYNNNSHVRTITIVGLESSGKSNITFHLVATNATNYVALPTAGVDFHELQLSSSTFHIYDCGGISRYRTQWPYYIQKSDGVVFVIDRTDKERMGRVQEEIADVLIMCEKLNLPILIFINKSDINTTLTTEDFIKITKADNYDVEYTIQDCSAKTGDGINSGRDWLLQHIHPRNAGAKRSKSASKEVSESKKSQSRITKSQERSENDSDKRKRNNESYEEDELESEISN